MKTLRFNPTHLWCLHHASPWRDVWPGGDVLVGSIELCVKTIDELSEAIEDADYSQLESVDVSQLDNWIKLLQPICCFLELVAPEKLIEVYQKAETKHPGIFMLSPV